MATKIEFAKGELTPELQQVITEGFARHSSEHQAPPYERQRINWLAYDDSRALVGALTADALWDWIYIDELWVDESCRGQGLGKNLMQEVEEYAKSQALSGVWLWTQSWQAADFYRGLGYTEFTRFENFPKGHFRLGFRKQI